MSAISFITPVRKVVLYNTSSQIAGRMLATATTFLISIILVRYFGIYTYGDFIKITTFVAPFYLLTDFGINAVFIQYVVPHNSISEAETWTSLLSVRIILSFILMFFILFIVLLLPNGNLDGYTKIVRIGILLYAPTILFQSIITSANAIFQKHLRYSFAAVSNLAGSVATLVAITILLQLSPSLNNSIYAASSLGFGVIISACTSIYFVKTILPVLRISVQKSVMISWFQKSIPLGVTLIFNLIYFRIDSYILTLTRSTAEVGVYGFVYKVFETALVFPTFFMNAVYPFLITTDSSTLKRSYTIRLLRSALFLLGASLLVLGTFLFAAQFITLIHEQFEIGIGALQVLSFGLPFFYLSSLTMWILIAYKKMWILVYIYGFSMLLNIILNIMFIPKYGLLAASWTTVVCEIIVLVLSVFFIWRYISLKYKPGDNNKSIIYNSSV